MWRRLRVMAGASIGALMAVVMVAAPAGAAEAKGCSGTASSVAKDGAAIQTVTAPGSGGTKSSPFRVDPDGTVNWSGTTDAAIKDGRWKVNAWPFAVTGRIGNAEGLTTKSGVDKVKDRLPLEMPGLYYVKVTLSGTGGASCVASGWVRITGSATFTPMWIAGLLSTGLGAGGIGSLAVRLMRGGRK